jgi:hypothetical protein
VTQLVFANKGSRVITSLMPVGSQETLSPRCQSASPQLPHDTEHRSFPNAAGITLKILYSISRRNPKIRWAGDAKIPGDGDAEVVPGLGDFATPEIGRGVRDKSACGMAFSRRDVSVHEAP